MKKHHLSFGVEAEALLPLRMRSSTPFLGLLLLQWLNKIVSKAWPFYDKAICTALKVHGISFE